MWELRKYDRYLAHISKLVEKLNAHMPKERKTLAQLLAEEDPYVEAVDGSKIYFKRRDLERLAGRIPRELHGRLHLPIVVVRRLEMGKGIYVVYGGEVEKRLVANLLGLSQVEGEIQLYRPQVSELLSQLKSLLTIGFEAPEEF
ncbi:MAG: DUF61 family protein [Candidatus Hecatellaceae archaeon]